jgi:hypothetical protein
VMNDHDDPRHHLLALHSARGRLLAWCTTEHGPSTWRRPKQAPSCPPWLHPCHRLAFGPGSSRGWS